MFNKLINFNTRTQKVSAVLLTVSVLVAICISWQTPTPNTDFIITIDGSTKGPELNKDMYGIFFEDINHAADGGLYAELLQNRDFEYNRTPEQMKWLNDASIITENGWRERFKKPGDLFAWSLVNKNGASGIMRQTGNMPLSAENPMSLELEVKKYGTTQVINNGYWGIPVKAGEKYELSLYSHKNQVSNGKINVSLQSLAGKVYAQQTIDGIGADWKQFTATLTANTTDPHARFVITPLSAGKLWLDMVSLFPRDTYAHRPNGMRKDLAGMLAALHPSFMRFPGGCVVEGATLDNRIQWKKTIGDIAHRPGNWNVWRYHTTEGLGFHEFLQLCEDLKVSPMYVINVGMSCQARAGYCIPQGEVDDYLQDTFDALEYAMGPADSKWGAVRAKNGHKAPFKIKYVEIGNENHGPYYQEAYKTFQSAIKRKYPEITTIADEPVDINDTDRQKHPGASVEMVDEHYYKSPSFFYANQQLYDSYNRASSPKIYIGEFAVTTPDGGAGNMAAALGEAAFMVGMERNADIVRMASYAPTFVNTNDRRWMPDMIVFNTSQAYGTPSYYALQTFSANRPDYILPSKVTSTNDQPVEKNFENLKGGVAFNSRNAKTAYRDIKVIINDRDVLNDDMKHGLKNWTVKGDNWDAKDGVLSNRYDEMKANIMLIHNDWKNYTFSFKAKKISGEDGLHISFLNGGGGACTLNLTEDSFNLMQNAGSIAKSLGKNKQKLVDGKWYDVKIDIRSATIKCYIDGKLTFENELLPNTYTGQIFAVSGIKESSHEVIVKIVNPNTKTRLCKIDCQNLNILSEGKVTVVKAANQTDENSFEKPHRVTPVTSKLNNLDKQFYYECPANSISVLRLAVKN